MTTKEKTNSNKKTARIVGVLFIIATVSTIISLTLTGSILDDLDYLINVSANETQLITGALFMLLDAVSVAGIAIMLYPILKKQNEASALGYVGARIVESVLFIVYVIILLTLLTLSQEFVKAGAPDPSYFQTEGTLLLSESDWTFTIGLGFVFALSALILNYSLYQSRLVPRWLSGWGFIGATLVFALTLLEFYSINLSEILNLPIALQEMVFAVWLIVKGFNSNAIASKSA